VAISSFTGLPTIPENSEATPGLWNARYSILSQNLDQINSDLSAPSFEQYLDLEETTQPANPVGDTLRIYNADHKGFSILNFVDSSGMNRKFVRDSVIIGYNDTGSSIPAFRAVYASGSTADVPTLAKARSNNTTTMPAIGVTLEAIDDAAFGRVMQVGIIEGVNTSAFSAGDVLYVHSATAGVATNVAPIYPNTSQEIGTILASDAVVGALQIVARSQFNNGTSGATLGIPETFTPSVGTASGATGAVTWDTSYVYVCTSTDSWRRATLAAF
jgi:hypothetical protein